jgi:Transmembrane domain of unknown function (DUF3566)
MNAALGLLVVVLSFLAAAYVVVVWRPELPSFVVDALLAAIGAALGVGALLFQDDVSLAGGLLAPVFAGALVVAHVRGLDLLGVRLPTRAELPSWMVDIPPLRGRAAYATAPTASTFEEPVAQQRSITEPEPDPAIDPDPELEPMPELDDELTEELTGPLGAATTAEPAWPQTVVGARTALRLPRRGARRTRVEVRRLSPFSVLKFSVIFYFCIFLVIYLALAMIWAVLQASGVIDSLEELLGDVFPSGTGISPTGEVSTGGAPPLEIDTGQVFTWLFLAGCVGVVIWSLINVFLSVMYNLISDIVGGVEVTLADRRD